MVMDEIIQGDHRTKKGEESRNRKRNTEKKGSSLKAFSSNSKGQGRTRDVGYH